MEGDRNLKIFMVSALYRLLPVIILLFPSGASADGNVTLESLTIYRSHEWFGRKPTIYYRCGQESKVYLPDVVHKDQDYLFIGQESWQPLTTLYGEKCKRCGLYEEDTIKADDIFYEAELCPRDFNASQGGRLTIFEEGEVNATLLCPDCIPKTAENSDDPGVFNEEENSELDGTGEGIAVLIIVLVFVVLSALGIIAYSKWRQKLRREQQARFLKMFEDDDDLDAELGLKDDDL